MRLDNRTMTRLEIAVRRVDLSGTAAAHLYHGRFEEAGEVLRGIPGATAERLTQTMFAIGRALDGIEYALEEI